MDSHTQPTGYLPPRVLGGRAPNSFKSPPASSSSFGRYGDDTGFTYPYTTQTPERMADKPTPVRQGSSSMMGAINRSSVPAPPTDSLFTSDSIENTNENQLHYPKDPSLLATPSRTDENFSDFDQLDRWITVFGFPSSHSSVILSYFHNFGQILRVKYPENGGNWIHILYMTRLQAEKALGKNGKILDPGNIMIGVVRCTDPSIVSEKLSVPTQTSKRLRTDSYNPTVPDYAVTAPEPQPAPSASLWSKFLDTVIGY